MASNEPTKYGSQDQRFPLDPVTWQKVAARMQLAPMQAAVLEWVLLDLKNSHIGKRLGIGEATVKTHLQELFGKTRLRSRLQLAVRACQLAIEIERQTPPKG